MNQEQDIIDPQYLKGFNQGYTMAKYLPETSAKIANNQAESPHLQGFREGREQYLMETVREKYPEWLKSNHPKYKEPFANKGKDRDADRE